MNNANRLGKRNPPVFPFVVSVDFHVIVGRIVQKRGKGAFLSEDAADENILDGFLSDQVAPQSPGRSSGGVSRTATKKGRKGIRLT